MSEKCEGLESVCYIKSQLRVGMETVHTKKSDFKENGLLFLTFISYFISVPKQKIDLQNRMNFIALSFFYFFDMHLTL
jgi:hypothetical protein